ncbi:MAG: DUF2007 domain-containing protein [Bacteroidota bacterium]
MKDFKKIAVFTYPHEYSVLKLLLEKANLRFFFQNETVIGIVPFYSNAMGGIFLKVHPADLAEAQQILKDFNREDNLDLID